MYYIIENGKITGSSENYLSSENGITIQKDFTNEELEKINAGYNYNIDLGEFKENPESIEFEKQQIENKKTSLLKEIGELKTIKDGMELVGEDTTEIIAKINDLISEYKN